MEAWIAGLFGRKVVYLRHFDGQIEKKWASRTPFGLVCTSIGARCLLLEGGDVEGDASWVDEWRPKNPTNGSPGD